MKHIIINNTVFRAKKVKNANCKLTFIEYVSKFCYGPLDRPVHNVYCVLCTYTPRGQQDQFYKDNNQAV